jgi:gluconolactonase
MAESPCFIDLLITSTEGVKLSLTYLPDLQVKKVSLKTGNVSTVFPVTDVANGMALDNDGNLLICQQGQGAKPGYIERVDLKNLNSSIVADNWFGVPFNSPNDVVVKSDGSIWFTDPSYGR